VTLEAGPDSVVLRVADDRGFVGSTVLEEHGELRSTRERALLVGGELAIKERPKAASRSASKCRPAVA
jgi:signal transduction histidine kinase